MFNNLTDFSYKRSIKEAIGFYIAYWFSFGLMGFLLGLFMSFFIRNLSFESGMGVGTIMSMVLCPLLSFLIMKSKNLLGNFIYIILLILSSILAFFGGGLLGLIPVAFLTTR